MHQLRKAADLHSIFIRFGKSPRLWKGSQQQQQTQYWLHTDNDLHMFKKNEQHDMNPSICCHDSWAAFKMKRI